MRAASIAAPSNQHHHCQENLVDVLQDATAEAAALRARVEELQKKLGAAQTISPATQTPSTAPPSARWRSVEDFPRDRPLFVSFSNGHYANLMMNWVQTLRVLEVRLCLGTEFCRS